MAHRLQYRRDTKANWLKYNPVLMEGEVGYETDTHHQKVGDGVSKYSELEYEVGVGNITQETGDSESLVMSQKAVSEAIPKVVNDFTTGGADKALSAEMGKEIVSKLIPTNTLFSDTGLLSVDGTVNEFQTSWRVTPYILLEGETTALVQGYSGGKEYPNYPLCCLYDENYSLLASFGNDSGVSGLTRMTIDIVEGAKYLRVSARSNQLDVSFVILDFYNKIIKSREELVKTDAILLRGLSKRYLATKDGYVFNTNGYVANSTYKSSELIKVKEGDIIELTTDSLAATNTIWGFESKKFSTGKTLVKKSIDGQASRYLVIIPTGINYICFCGRIGYDSYIDVYSECVTKVEGLDNDRYEIEHLPLSITNYIINPNNGKQTLVADAGAASYIPVHEGEVYYYSGRATAYNIGVAGYSYNEDALNLVAKIIYNGTDAIIQQEECSDVEFTIPSGVDYIACSTRNQDTFPLILKKRVTKTESINFSDVLLSYDKIQGYALNSQTGASYILGAGEVTNYIPVQEGELLKVSGLFGSQSGIVGYGADKSFKLNIADNGYRDGLHCSIKEAKQQLIRVPTGVHYIRVSTTDRIEYPVEVRRVVSIQTEISKSNTYNEQLKYVWFGDSISQLGSLPHQTCKKMGVDVVDASFAGAPLTYSIEKYQATGFMGLVDCIVNNDFTPTETALQIQEDDGVDISNKLINLNNLKNVDWISVTHVVVLAGTNDLSFSAATIDNIKQGLSSAISKLITKYPHVTLYFISPPYRGNINNTVNGLDLLEINNAIREVCESYNFPYLDFFHNCGVNSVNRGYFLDSQELHPNIEGERLWTTKLANWLRSI